MKIDGMEWMEWLHKKREQDHEERERQGISIAEYLRGIEVESKAVAEKLGIETLDLRKIKF